MWTLGLRRLTEINVKYRESGGPVNLQIRAATLAQPWWVVYENKGAREEETHKMPVLRRGQTWLRFATLGGFREASHIFLNLNGVNTFPFPWTHRVPQKQKSEKPTRY